VPKTRRRHADREQFWRDTIAAWKESGQSVRGFCTARGVAEATFFARRRELANRVLSPRPAATHGPSPTFAAVRVIPDPTVEIVLPGGLLVRVPVGADPTAVAHLVAALGGRPC
jgi:transposase